MKLKYTGPLREVLVRPLGMEPFTVERGKQVEVPDELGTRLLEQVGNWAEVGESKKADKKKGEE